jgi:hypothetical protein
LRAYHPAKFAKILISVEKFKFSQILLGDKNATSLCSKNISTLTGLTDKIKNSRQRNRCRKKIWKLLIEEFPF